jgi:hypothetical protein
VVKIVKCLPVTSGCREARSRTLPSPAPAFSGDELEVVRLAYLMNGNYRTMNFGRRGSF